MTNRQPMRQQLIVMHGSGGLQGCARHTHIVPLSPSYMSVGQFPSPRITFGDLKRVQICAYLCADGPPVRGRGRSVPVSHRWDPKRFASECNHLVTGGRFLLHLQSPRSMKHGFTIHCRLASKCMRAENATSWWPKILPG